MYDLIIIASLFILLCISTIVGITSINKRKTDLKYLYDVATAINTGNPIPTYMHMDKPLRFVFLYVRQMAKEYKRLIDAEKTEKERIDELVRKWQDLKPQIIPTPRPIDSLTFYTNFFNGLGANFMVPEIPQEKQAPKVKHNESITPKVKAYFYDSSKTLGNIEMCQLMQSRIGSEWCIKRCDFYISHGSNQKGRYIKCLQLDKALGK